MIVIILSFKSVPFFIETYVIAGFRYIVNIDNKSSGLFAEIPEESQSVKLVELLK